ncbi:TRAP transporter large permease [Neomoorella mulderi]|uniref:Sialic acid TRAP transporter permease protein SiaT n=1 Tax=Moorella mulderi DSM 14980 TaxID=1122241 RepID=A0A151B132_9FIRM|nr:TRAP transporter large permease [Moorella mulderi]KYH33357.1 sialic acid TRAP transporter permease protein SiaT [Moorella mulderi DSM 14980]
MVGVLTVSFIVLLILTVPIGFAMGLSSIIALIFQDKIPLIVVVQRIFTGMDSFPFLAIPLFVIAGALMDTGGIAIRLVNLAKALVGFIRGGLGMSVVVGEILFSGISGSTTADVSAISSLLIPAMKKAGYSIPNSVSIVSAASAMGILVPPCINMVILGAMTDQSIGALFMAGFIPAFVMAAVIMVLIYYQAVREGLPADGRPSLKTLGRTLKDGLIPMLFPIIIFGGILGGIFTVTEAAAVAVIYALFVGVFVYREITMQKLINILAEAAITTALVVFLIGTASIFSWLLTSQMVPQKLGAFIHTFTSSKIIFLLLSNLVFIIMGGILEGAPALIIFIPIMMPIAQAFGVDPLHYSILAIACVGIGLFLPPIGVGILVACRIAGITVNKVFKAMLPYIVVLLIGLLIITFVPWFSLVLPKIFSLV